MKRSSGVLLHISSLPGEYGIGGFTADAYHFIEVIATMGFHWWQMLPVTIIGEGNSPYSGVSSYAGNFLFIDVAELEGLVNKEESDSAKYYGSIYLTDYEFAARSKRRILELAFSRTDDAYREKLTAFAEENEWLPDYAMYMSIRECYGNDWTLWPEGYKLRKREDLVRAEEEYRERILYYYFEQYHFYRQWKKLKTYANQCGIYILGDLPMYVCYDSVDVWANPKAFLLDEDLKMKKVAGVPPDYFNAEGQLWGNPIYDYEYLRKNNFDFLIKRIVHNLSLYDELRIDHFRGFYKYWAVEPTATTAKDGEWCDGPKLELWDALRAKIGEPNIIVEDLGIIGKDIVEYVKATGFLGMRVMQFGFDGDPDNSNLPHNYPIDAVAYTATHDNDTTLGWLMSLDAYSRENILTYVGETSDGGWASGGGNCRATKAFIRAVLASSATLAIIPLQDLCGYGSDTRMNTPGVAKGNWIYRTNYTAMEGIDVKAITAMNMMFGRNRLPL